MSEVSFKMSSPERANASEVSDLVILNMIICLILCGRNNMVNKSKIDKLKEAAQAVRDLNRNYWDMRRDNTVGGDDYFHCKANYEATSRESIGEKVAEKLGMQKKILIITITKHGKVYQNKKLIKTGFMIEQLIKLVDKEKKVVYIKTQRKVVNPLELEV